MIAALSGEWCVFDKITMTTGNIEIKCPKCGYINEIDLSLRKGSVKFRKKESAKTDSLNQGKSLSKNGTPVTFLIEKTDYNNGLLFFINSIKGKVIIDYYKTNFPTC